MADLASAAGLSRPALYLVFPGKAEVFQAVVEWMTERMLTAIHESLKDEWPLETKLLHALEISVAQAYDAVKSNPDAEDLLSLDREVPAVEASYAKLQDFLADLLGDAIQKSGLNASPAEVARTLMSALRGFKLVASGGEDLRRLIAVQISLTGAALEEARDSKAASSRGRASVAVKKTRRA
jgi:AcrR family transcriptional regulator